MDCGVKPCNDGKWKGLGREKERSVCCVLLARDSVFDKTQSPYRDTEPLGTPPSCHGSPMASMPLVLLSQGLRVWRGNGMDCRVEPCNDGEWSGLRREKERSACCVLLARHSVFDNTQILYRDIQPLDTLRHAMARLWHPCRSFSCRKDFWWGEETEWIAGSSPAMTGNGRDCGDKRCEVRVGFFWRATQSSTTRKAPVETLSPSTHPPSCHGSPMASTPLAILSQRLLVGRKNGMDCRVEPCNDKGRCVMTKGDV
ncbi:hypothetical protein ACSSV1_003379 [Labrenzia sp. MBR-25]